MNPWPFVIAAYGACIALTAALLLWSAWHGVASLRLHKNDWDWGMTAQHANHQLVTALTARPAPKRPEP